MLKPGSWSFTWTLGRNAKVTIEVSEVDVDISEGNKCIYGTGTGTLTGVANTTETATMEIKAEVQMIKTIEGMCVSPTKWTATYTVTTPEGTDSLELDRSGSAEGALKPRPSFEATAAMLGDWLSGRSQNDR